VILPITDSWFVSSAFISGELLLFPIPRDDGDDGRFRRSLEVLPFRFTDSSSVSSAFISGELLVFRSRAMTAISAIE
jgi:hypothetical protein